jgi:EmrB/QacA subfamily drug resistance transporter
MDLLDGTIVNVAAPTIRQQLGASSSALEWVIGAYALAFAMGLIAGGRLGDIYGRRRLFVAGSIGFVVASVASACAVNPAMLIGCRLAQGAAAALLIPQGLGIVRDVFAPEDRGSAFAVFGPVIGLSAVLGPIVGGALVDLDAFGTSWRLVFLVNVPLGLFAAFGAVKLMPESRSPQPSRLDAAGALIGATAMGLLIYPLVQGREAGWPAWAYVMMAASGACFMALVVWSRHVRRRGRHPLVESSLFRHRAYTSGLACAIVFFGGMVGTLLVLTVYLQFGEHFSAIHAGLTLAPFAIGSALGATLAATVIVPRLGRTTLQLAAVLLAGGTWWLVQTVEAHGLATTSLDLAPSQLLLGVGIGMLISPLFDFVLASVGDAEVGSASGVLNAGQQLAGAIGVAVMGTVFFTTLAHSGDVVALTRCLWVELATAPVLFVLTRALPRRPRDPEPAATKHAANPVDEPSQPLASWPSLPVVGEDASSLLSPGSAGVPVPAARGTTAAKREGLDEGDRLSTVGRPGGDAGNVRAGGGNGCLSAEQDGDACVYRADGINGLLGRSQGGGSGNADADGHEPGGAQDGHGKSLGGHVGPQLESAKAG